MSGQCVWMIRAPGTFSAREQCGVLLTGSGRVTSLTRPLSQADSGPQRNGMVNTQNPLSLGEQGGVHVPGCGRIACLPHPAGKINLQF